MPIGESVKSPQPVAPPPAPPARPPQRRRLKLLLAPLLGLSLVLHGLLLLAPAPSSRPAPQTETEDTAEDEFVDLLSIGTLSRPEPETVSPPPEAAPPPPAATAPPPPSQPIAPTRSPNPPAAAPIATDTPPPPEPAFTAEPEPATAAVPDEEVVEIFTRLSRGSGESDFDSTATSFPAIAYLIPQGIAAWSPQDQACFFTQIDDATYSTQPSVVSLRYLTRNVQLIEEQDIPRTFPPPQYQVNRVADGYCNRPLFQVVREGQPYLFISLVGIGVGASGQQASGLVLIWADDPRAG
ncbi:hypothetical protein VB780_19880 [Leptolyngbya sp. CCNP1308]|uniref:hypothetical protein n=1 Tax=Leptolyngbya sp. CCNP1308 TaxID=3110255 RepID=UPI002B1F7A43|nr:hypothetical protein [Leptolyngbya sp. CCNP1308]MEA5450850.1 hypothetical protein [Leptolyngbya sp. CCNP1308]